MCCAFGNPKENKISKSAVSGLNDCCPVALTPILMKCFENKVLQHIKDNSSASLDLQQYVFRTNKGCHIYCPPLKRERTLL